MAIRRALGRRRIRTYDRGWVNEIRTCGDPALSYYRGMMVASPARALATAPDPDTDARAQVLTDLARKAHLPRYKKSPRGPKKARPRRTRFAQKKHIATSRLLADEKRQK